MAEAFGGDSTSTPRYTYNVDILTAQPSLPIRLPLGDLRAICIRHGVQELALFGSVLRNDFGADSDVDVLVTFRPEIPVDLFHLMDMEQELARLFGRRVDLVSRRAIERSRNWLRRQEILSTARILYAA